MKRFLLTAMIAGLLAPAGLYAQEVYKDGNRVVLDLTEEAGMPADAITSVSKTAVYVSSDPKDDDFLRNTDNSIFGDISKTVYRKLEIAPKDLNTSGTIVGGVSSKFKWAESFLYCRSLNYNGGEWRLPTQRELMLMYIFSPALNAIFKDMSGGTEFSDGYYWSVTEAKHYESWYVSFPNGNTYFHHKSNNAYHGYVRCVRELQ